MEPQDALVVAIRRYVTTVVPAELVEPTTRAVVLTVSRLMADPNFTNQLALVQKLRAENEWLRNNLMIAQETLRSIKANTPRPRKQAPRKRQAPKTARNAFQQGVRDVRGH